MVTLHLDPWGQQLDSSSQQTASRTGQQPQPSGIRQLKLGAFEPLKHLLCISTRKCMLAHGRNTHFTDFQTPSLPGSWQRCLNMSTTKFFKWILKIHFYSFFALIFSCKLEEYGEFSENKKTKLKKKIFLFILWCFLLISGVTLLKKVWNEQKR